MLDVLFILVRQVPSPNICNPAATDCTSADAKRDLVSVVRILLSEQLRSDYTADLAYAGLKGEGECGACGAYQSCGSPWTT